MALHCPFCGSLEVARVNGSDESENPVVLLMFDCPFFFRMNSCDKSDLELQAFLDSWREKEGGKWLESVGPVMKERELKNIQRASRAPPKST